MPPAPMSTKSSRMIAGPAAVVAYLRRRPESRVTQGVEAAIASWRAANPRAVTRTVAMEKLLCGGENGLPADTYARHTGNFFRPSTPFSQSPHVKFLEQYREIGDAIFERGVFSSTAYFGNAVECMRATGQYFHCTREDQVHEVARRFVARFLGEVATNDDGDRWRGFSTADSMVRVRLIEGSDCYEVIDGNHRLAIHCVQGVKTERVEVSPGRARTPLQQLLLDYGWCATRGVHELYQPVSSPELSTGWTLIRNCSDRMGMMGDFLDRHRELLPAHPSYLDVASSYGWFVNAFGKKGFEAHGVEMDWAGVEIGTRVYGLKPGQLTRSEAVRFIENHGRTYDVVSCFSLLHHFVLGRASVSATDMLRLLDRITGTVLFMDMGQEHEAWFRDSLSGWNPDTIERWLRENSSFKQFYTLGTDRDSVPPFEANYGRTLFACTR